MSVALLYLTFTKVCTYDVMSVAYLTILEYHFLVLLP